MLSDTFICCSYCKYKIYVQNVDFVFGGDCSLKVTCFVTLKHLLFGFLFSGGMTMRDLFCASSTFSLTLTSSKMFRETTLLMAHFQVCLAVDSSSVELDRLLASIEFSVFLTKSLFNCASKYVRERYCERVQETKDGWMDSVIRSNLTCCGQ